MMNQFLWIKNHFFYYIHYQITHIFDQSIALLSQEDNLDVGHESKMPV